MRMIDQRVAPGAGDGRTNAASLQQACGKRDCCKIAACPSGQASPSIGCSGKNAASSQQAVL
jgi:hypothetical protein